MTGLGGTLTALREAIAAAGDAGPADLDAVPGRAQLAKLEVTRDPDRRIALAVATLARPSPLDELETAFGPASPLPRRPAGGARTVQFLATLPGEGERGVTVLAELDGDGRAVRVILRPDAF